MAAEHIIQPGGPNAVRELQAEHVCSQGKR